MKHLFCILSTALILTACSSNDSTGTAADPTQDSKDNPETSHYSCKAALEGVIAYLNKEKIAYICQDEYWADYEDAALFTQLENTPACNDIDKIAVISNRTAHTTIVCHDRSWFFGEE